MVSPTGELMYADQSHSYGRILEISQEGPNGFGYDPIFEFSFHFPGKSAANITMEEKGSVSHRGRVIKGLVDYLGRKFA